MFTNLAIERGPHIVNAIYQFERKSVANRQIPRIERPIEPSYLSQ